MKAFLQNHPGEREAKHKPDPSQSGKLFLAAFLLVLIPVIIAIAVLHRLHSIGRIDGWLVYVAPAVLFLLCTMAVTPIARRLALKSVFEQRSYYRLAGGVSWLPQEKREALQLEAHYCYHTGGWVETLEYWPSEIRVPGKARFTTFQLVTKEERLAANDQAWAVLSEKSYTERVAVLFAGMHSSLFALDNQLLTAQNRNAMITRLSELTQLPDNYITSCWVPQGNKPSALLWAFDLQRIIELSRTSFMAGIISEHIAWENILQASAYAHALFDNLDEFFNNYRIGHAYWSNDFKRTNEVSLMHRSYNKDCNWPIKEVPWTKKHSSLLPGVIMNSCNGYVEEEMRKRTHNTIGFRSGNHEIN